MYCLNRGFYKREKILCARQFQNSIKDSVLSLLAEQIEVLGMQGHYTVQRDAIYGANGTEFIFRGLHNNHASIKSINGVTLCWVEEGQSVSQSSLDVLIPTIRAPGSQLIFTFNVDLEKDPVYKMFLANPPPSAYVRKVNYDENPFFPQVLRAERPDVVLILPWNLREEIVEQLAFIGEWGGRFAARSPEIRIFP